MNSQTYDYDLWNNLKQRYAASKMQMLQSGSLKIKDRTMNFVYKTKGALPQAGYALVIGMHGGGGCPAETNNQQYNNHKNLYDSVLPDGTIWLTPRSCEDEWDMWFKDYMEDFFLQFIRAFSLNGMIDLNRVYITGYSAGGDGVYHMAPRLADHLAGAAMMAGHPNGTNLMNVRNIGFSVQVGQNDSSYNRKNEAVKYIRMLNQLNQNYDGFKHQSKIQAGKPHWMGGLDGQVFKWLLNFTRNPYPDTILYKECSRRKKTTFYYLRLGASKNNKDDEEVLCFKQGNTFKIFSNRTITVLVNNKFVNPNEPVTIIHNGQVTVQRAMQFKPDVAEKTLVERIDPYYIFEDEFVSEPPRIIDIKTVMCDLFSISAAEKDAEYEKSLPTSPEQTPSSFSQSFQPSVKRSQPLNLGEKLSKIGGAIGSQVGQLTNNIGNQTNQLAGNLGNLSSQVGIQTPILQNQNKQSYPSQPYQYGTTSTQQSNWEQWSSPSDGRSQQAQFIQDPQYGQQYGQYGQQQYGQSGWTNQQQQQGNWGQQSQGNWSQQQAWQNQTSNQSYGQYPQGQYQQQGAYQQQYQQQYPPQQQSKSGCQNQ